jgi:hypothetical protein
MKTENDDLTPLSRAAQRAFENYPQITASPDFNRRVLERVLAAPAPSRLEFLFNYWADRMDEIFARPILKLLGAAFMGAMFALVGCGVFIALCGISPQAGSTPSAPTVAMNNRAPDALLADSLSPRNRMAWARAGFAPPSSWEYSVPPMNEMQSPARREKSVSEMEDKRSSSCPAAFRSLV